MNNEQGKEIVVANTEVVVVSRPLKWWCFDQNNSGGFFSGPAYEVHVQAPSRDLAVAVAEENGLYFGGRGDCPCCGNRWYEPFADDGTDVPSKYGHPIDLNNRKDVEMWSRGGRGSKIPQYLIVEWGKTAVAHGPD